ncbi:4007_t:CDS:2, partial [Ambispora leptoticha]
GFSVVEFWKNLLDARIIFPIRQDMKRAELNALESYSTIENNYVLLNKGVTTDSDGMLYDNGKKTNVKLPSILMNDFGGMLCLPDGVFFLGNKSYGSKLLIRNCYLQLFELIKMNCKSNGPASAGCTITGTPGIGKTYFGLSLLFYIRYNYPEATIVWQYNEKMCYQFLPNDNVQKEDINLFNRTLDSPNNFFLVDAQALTFNYQAYMIQLTSPKEERFKKAVKWPGFAKYFMPLWELEEITALWTLQYKNKKNFRGEEFTLELVGELLDRWGPIPRSVLLKWDDVAYQQNYQQLINEVNLEDCINSIDKSGMPTDTISGRLVYLDPDPEFASVVYRVASPRVFNRVIQEYEIRTKRNARDLIMSSPEFRMFRGNMFEDIAHRTLQNGGIFRVRCLNGDNSDINERNIKEMECNWFTTLNEARKEYYNRPKSKTFASINSFSLDNKTLDLYQITISENHSLKKKGLNDLDRLLPWRKDVNDFNLYFVVPSNIFETFPLQKYKTTKNENCQKIPSWIDNITQYALEINLGISNKSAKKRSSVAISGDYENEETTGKGTNKDAKKRKTKSDTDDETSESNVISGRRNLKRSNVIDNEDEDASKSDVEKMENEKDCRGCKW